MPLSSVVGAQSIVRPGVCTSSTRPASPYDGQVIYETDTDKTLVWNGSGWVYLATGTASPAITTAPALVLVKTQTIGTAVSTVAVSDAFSSTYDNYKITISGGVGSTELQLNMTLGSSSTQYYTAGVYGNYTSGSTGTVNVDNGSSWLRVGYTNSSPNPIVMNYEICGPFLASNTFGLALISRNGGFLGTVSHLHNVATSYSSFTLTTSTGTLTGGTIRVYGYVNS
jgi:hypothetical protein